MNPTSQTAPEADALVQTLRAGNLLRAGAPVVVLLSGGRDSVCLLDLAVRVAGANATSALHVNYGLRAEADEDERHCAWLCAELGVELEVQRPTSGPSGNLQGWARAERYVPAARVAARRGADVASAHTASDQVETVLYRLAASPGRRALLGMPARAGRLVRPLLEVTREQTAAYCRARGLPWREDPTNADPAFARARARHRAVPALRELHPAAERNLLRTVAALREEAAALDAIADEALADDAEVELARLERLPRALRALVVRRLAERVTRSSPRVDPNAVDGLLSRAHRGGTVSLELGGGVTALAQYGRLRIAQGGPRPAPRPAALTLPGRARFGCWRLDCEFEDAERALGRAVAAARRQWSAGGSLVGALDASSVGEALLVRARRPGDRLAPLGLGGHRTLQDLLVDRKVPRAERAELPVVEARGAIAWVAGVATEQRFRVRRGRRAVLVVASREEHDSAAS